MLTKIGKSFSTKRSLKSSTKAKIRSYNCKSTESIRTRSHNTAKRNQKIAGVIATGAVGYGAKKANDRRKENKTIKGRIKNAIGR